jgi:hypothetical protein
MKYYTPDLLARFGSEDLKVAKSARLELEKNAEKYVAHLERIRPQLPHRFTEVQERFYLHDARVVAPVLPWVHPEFAVMAPFAPLCGLTLEARELAASPGRVPSLILVLQLDPPPQEFLVLHYRFVMIDEVSHHPRLREERGTPLEWLHDEVELISSNDHVEYGHSILFTHGLELRLRFRDFDYATLSPMVQQSELAETGTAKP